MADTDEEVLPPQDPENPYRPRRAPQRHPRGADPSAVYTMPNIRPAPPGESDWKHQDPDIFYNVTDQASQGPATAPAAPVDDNPYLPASSAPAATPGAGRDAVEPGPIYPKLPSQTTVPIGTPRGGSRGGGRGGGGTIAPTNEVFAPAREQATFESAQRALPPATPERLRAEADKFQQSMQAARAAGRHQEAAGYEDAVNRLNNYADALEQTRDFSGKVTSAFLGPILNPFPAQEETIAGAQQPGALPSAEEQARVGITAPTGATPRATPGQDLAATVLGSAPYFELGGMAGRALGGGARVIGEALETGGALGRSGAVRALGTGVRSIGEAIGSAAPEELPMVAGPRPLNATPANVLSNLGTEMQQFQAQLPARVGRGLTQGQVVGAGISYREARLNGADPLTAANAAIENMVAQAGFGAVSELGTGALASAVRGAAAVTGGVARGTTEALASRLRPAEAADAVTQMQLMDVGQIEVQQGAEAQARQAGQAVGGAAQEVVGAAKQQVGEQRALSSLATTDQAAQSVREGASARELGAEPRAPAPRPEPSAEEHAAVGDGSRERLAELYQRNVVEPVSREEALPETAQKSLSRTLTGGLAGAGEEVHFPPEFDRAAIERVLQRASYAGREAGLMHAVPDPEGARQVVELDVGREMTPEEYRRAMTAIHEADPEGHVDGSSVIQLRPEAKIQLALPEGRTAADAARVLELAREHLGPEAKGVVYPGTVIEGASASDRARLAGLLAERGGAATAGSVDPRAALWQRGVAAYAKTLALGRSAAETPVGQAAVAAARKLGVERGAALAAIPALAAFDKGDSEDRNKLLALGAMVVAGTSLVPHGGEGGRELVPEGPQSRGFVSRLRNAVDALPKSWDAARPAADWIGKLTGSEAPKFSKAELQLIRPLLEDAKTKGVKVSRADVQRFIDAKSPQIERVTLGTSAVREARGENFGAGNADEITDIDELIDREAPGHDYRLAEGVEPETVTEQIDNRAAKITEIEDEIESRIAGARREMEDAQEVMDQRETELRDTLSGAGLDLRLADPAIGYLDEHVEAEYVPRDAVDKALELIQDDLYPSSDPAEILSREGYTWEEEPQAPPEADEFVQVTHANPAAREGPMGRRVENGVVTDEWKMPTPIEGESRESFLARIADRVREIYGPDAALKIIDRNAEERANFEPGPDEWVVRNSRGKEIARGDDEADVLQQAMEEEGLEPDSIIESVRRDLNDYADARSEYNRAESEHYYMDEGEYFEEEQGQVDTLKEEIEHLRSALDNHVARPAQLALPPVTEQFGADDPARVLSPEELAAKDPYLMPIAPEVKGPTGFASYQRIGGGTNYRELINNWINAPDRLTREAFGGHDYWSSRGAEKAVGHIRVEDHTIPEAVERYGLNKAEIVDADSDPADVIYAKRDLRVVRRQQEATRSDIAALMQEAERLARGVPEDQLTLTPELSDIGAKIRARMDHLNSLASEETQIFNSLGNERGEPIAVMLETQASLAQHQIAEQQKRAGRAAPTDAEYAELDRRYKEVDKAEDEAVAERERLAEAAHGAAATADPDHPYYAPDVLREIYQRGENWRADFPRFTDEQAAPIEAWRQARVRESELTAQRRELGDQLDEAKRAWKTAAQFEALSPLGNDQKAALSLNAARFLVDSAERGYDRIAWSDAANRMSNANLAGEGGSPTAAIQWYDNMTPAAIKRLLRGLGFDVPVEHISIRGFGHWSVELSPEIRRAIRRYGLPVLGVLALATPDQEAGAQGPDDNPYATAPTHHLAIALTSGLGLAIAAGAVAYLRKRGAARAALAGPAATALATAKTAVETAIRDQRGPARPSFLFPRREPTGTEYKAPIDVSNTPSGKGAAQFNIAKLGLSPDGEQIFRDVVSKLDLTKHRVSHAETEAAAAERATDPQDLLTQKPWTGTEALAARMFQKQAVDRLEILSERVADPATSAEDRAAASAEMARVTADIGEMGAKLSKEREAAGRTLNAYKIVARSTLDEQTWGMLAQRAKQLPLTPEEQLKIRGLITAKDRAGLTGFVSSLHESSTVDKVLTWWKTNLLGLSTVLKVGTSHAIETADQMIGTPVAVGVDALAALVRGTPREKSGAFNFRAGPRLGGLVKGWKEGLEMLRKGSTITPEMAGRWDVKDVHYDTPIINGWVHLVHGVHNLAYRPFYMAALEASLDELADVYAARAVKADPSLDLKTARAALRAQPSNEMAVKAIDRAERAVYQNKGALAGLGAAVQREARARGSAARVAVETAVPFVKIPANIAMRAVDASPLGLVTAALRASPAVKSAGGTSKQARFAEDIARAFTGTAGFMALGYWLASQDNATGDYPTNPGDRNTWEAEGKIAHSVKLNGRWVNVSQLGPQGMMVALGAEVHEMLKANHGDASALFKGMAPAIGKTVSDQPFLKGIATGLASINDPVRAGGTYVQSQIGSAVPSMVNRAAKAVDPVRRERQGVVQEVESRIPGLSKRLPARVNAFGQEERETELGRAAAIPSPVSTSAASTDPVLKEIDRLGVGIPGATAARMDQGQRIATTPEERRAESREVGPEKRAAAERVITDRTYPRLDDNAKADILKRALELPQAARRAVDRIMLVPIAPEVRDRLIQETVNVKVQELLAEYAAGLPAIRRQLRQMQQPRQSQGPSRAPQR